MPRTIRMKLYQFSELSKAAKAKAIQEFWDINLDYDWWDFIYEEASELGFKITGFDLERGRSIDLEFISDPEDIAQKIIEQHGEQCDTYKEAKEFLDASTVLRVKIKLAGDEEDDFQDEAEELSNSFKKELSNCYWKMLREDYEYRYTDEAVKETIECNEYEFERDGTFHTTRRKAS